MKLAGYLRVSTEGQVDAYGKDVQRSEILRYTALSGDTITEWFEEDATSGTTEGASRPKMSEIIARADEFDGVIAFDVNRLGRRLVVQETLIGLLWAAGLRVVTSTSGELEADDDPTKILIRQVLGCVAEFQHREVVQKLRAARVVKSAGGGYIGGRTARYGLRVEGSGKTSRLVEDLEEMQVVSEICARSASGEHPSLIANSLNRKQVPTKMGKLWTSTQVQRILTR